MKQGSPVRREQIAQAVLSVLAVRGFRGLSVAEVAATVGLVPSAIYRHFRGKAQMLEAAMDLIRDRMMYNVQAVCEESPDALERLHRLLMRHMKFFLESRGVLRLVMSEDMTIGHPALRQRLYTNLSGYLAKVAGIAAQGQREKTIRGDVEAGTISLLFIGIIQPAMVMRHMSGDEFDVARHVRRAWRLFRDAIAAPAEKPARGA